MLDLLGLNKTIQKINEETLPILDEMLRKRLEQLNQGLAANIEDFMRLVERLEQMLSVLNGLSLRLEIPGVEEEEDEEVLTFDPADPAAAL